MKFKINGITWNVLQKTAKVLLDRYNSEHEEKANYVFGVTIYPTHEIWINEDMCIKQQIDTLKHELTHCYMWCYGLYNILNFNEEIICDIVSASNDFINVQVCKLGDKK